MKTRIGSTLLFLSLFTFSALSEMISEFEVLKNFKIDRPIYFTKGDTGYIGRYGKGGEELDMAVYFKDDKGNFCQVPYEQLKYHESQGEIKLFISDELRNYNSQQDLEDTDLPEWNDYTD